LNLASDVKSSFSMYSVDQIALGICSCLLCLLFLWAISRAKKLEKLLGFGNYKEDPHPFSLTFGYLGICLSILSMLRSVDPYSVNGIFPVALPYFFQYNSASILITAGLFLIYSIINLNYRFSFTPRDPPLSFRILYLVLTICTSILATLIILLYLANNKEKILFGIWNLWVAICLFLIMTGLDIAFVVFRQSVLEDQRTLGGTHTQEKDPESLSISNKKLSISILQDPSISHNRLLVRRQLHYLLLVSHLISLPIIVTSLYFAAKFLPSSLPVTVTSENPYQPIKNPAIIFWDEWLIIIGGVGLLGLGWVKRDKIGKQSSTKPERSSSGQIMDQSGQTMMTSSP